MGNKTENEFEKGCRIEFGISNEGKNIAYTTFAISSKSVIFVTEFWALSSVG
jgi:hypothetical protein